MWLVDGMTELNWKYVINSALSKKISYQIAELKEQHWKYGIDSQLQWMHLNIKNDDYHILGLDEQNQILAYATIVCINVLIDGRKNNYYGLGCVCIDKRIEGQGYGKKLIENANIFLQHNDKIGFLLCKESLVSFYKKCNWKEVSYSKATVSKQQYNLKIMAFPKMIDCNCIIIDRNF